MQAILTAVALSAGCNGQASSETSAPLQPPKSARVSAEQRNAALRAARVWQSPAIPIGRANLKENPVAPDGFHSTDEVPCRFSLEPVTGTTPKFNCQVAGGDTLKVKYGRSNPELFGEVAASRLLAALGFGADRMYLVKGMKCAGCPAFPFQSLKCLAETGFQSACFPKPIDYRKTADIEPAVIERRLAAEKIEATEDQGWAWYELDMISEAAGGSPRAEVDAFRLMAVFLAHWDNKAQNQRLACLEGGRRADGSCAKPFAFIQDLGATFGPRKVDLRNWQAHAIWGDPKTCTASMHKLPYAGATFKNKRISEGGRRLALQLLESLSQQQIVDLFTGSGITSYDHPTSAGRDPHAWGAAFADKVRQIREAGPCQ